MDTFIDWDNQDPEEGNDGVASMTDEEYKAYTQHWKNTPGSEAKEQVEQERNVDHNRDNQI